ncbi:uncharacterized protein DDB_G0283357-like isoform X2 [Chrysoperla carnea]|uniref:uncharacterized protein DDB_G0283357-like isoform X2 n=1 Tax=Chrysoperla carnea TaxID=189513 RepID=UPI001D05E4FD|nr:uncharacterized protein DDB_G0283357-like isoform X2 [Chrysoperla carnea]
MAQTCRTVRQVKQGERLRRSQHTAHTLLTPAEVEGYGPYKPVPPPKPLSTSTPTSNSNSTPTSSSASSTSAAVCFTPPPYRMPPYPLYNETTGGSILPGSIPSTNGLGGLDGIINGPNSNGGNGNGAVLITTPGGLHTHSNKFPNYPGNVQTNGNNDQHNMQYRTQSSTYQSAQDIYTTYKDQQNQGGNNNPSSTGAVPKQQTWHGNAIRQADNNGIIPNNSKTSQQSIQQSSTTTNNNGQNCQTVSVTIETKDAGGNGNTKDGIKNSKAMTKTYQTIRGMISSRFKTGGKENGDCEKNGVENDQGLNNVADELRKSNRSIDIALNDSTANQEERQITSILKKPPSGEQGIYGKPRTEGIMSQQQQQQQQQYNQQLQSQIMQMQQYQQYQTQQYQMLPGRSQEQMRIQQEQIYYHGGNNASYTQRPINRYGMQHTPEQSFMIMRHPQYGEIKTHVESQHVDDKQRSNEPRSQQQLERDSIRQKSFMEARRTASQPHLASDDLPKNQQVEGKNTNMHQLESQFPQPNRCGSYGNVMETFNARPVHAESEKDSDDGGFITHNNGVRNNEHINGTGHHGVNKQNEVIDKDSAQNDGTRVGLVGTPKVRLENEIGKIEGVYNLGQRMDRIELDTTENGEKVIDVTQRKLHTGSGTSSDYDKASGQTSSNVDSGRGSAAYSSGRRQITDDTSPESSDNHPVQNGNYGHNNLPSNRDSEWVDIVESELRHILEPKLHGLSLQGNNPQQPAIANSTLSESISSMTPPLPPLSPGDGSTPNVTPRNSTRYKHSASLPYGSKPDYGLDSYNKTGKSTVGPGVGGNSSRWQNSSSSKHRSMGKKHESLAMKGKHLYGLDLADITSTTTRSMDLDSMADGQSDSDGDISTTDARAIRKQLEGLETMYAEVLKLLGVKKYSGRYQPSDPRFNKRRYGSMSSLPSSSVSSRPIRDKRARAHEERKKVKDLRGINKRFQRLESHVVTLARSVAHLSSEMRTQHLMIQEMENIREELSALRTQTTLAAARAQSIPRGLNTTQKDMPSLANPNRVKKLTRFFGDEPPLLRLFLKSLGYEKYANAFENERVGMVELPYLSEERLQKIGIPLGPRLRILQEAQISVCKDTTLCIV